MCEDISQQPAGRLIMRRLKTAQQFVQGGHHLLCETCRYDVLISPARSEDRRELLSLLDVEQTVDGKQHVEGRKDRPSRDLGHLGDSEREEAARLTAWSVDEPDRLLVYQQSGWHFPLAQEALKS